MMKKYPLVSPDGRFKANGPGKRPYYNSRETDYCCSICGEPYNYFGIRESLRFNGDGEMTLGDVKKFMEGKGCPSCDFGKKSNFMYQIEGET